MNTNEFDIPLLSRGAWRGFCVLLLGGMVQPFVEMASRPLGFWWLAIVAIAAFAFAAGSAVKPGRSQHRFQGAVAALASYFLVVPLVVLGTHVVDMIQMSCTTALAAVVGAAVSVFRSGIHPVGER
ncbi:MAG: hypothetical protein JWR52_1131 [Marmoricola sp.]|nr:hypothetical protein [Marmoricola sp.]